MLEIISLIGLAIIAAAWAIQLTLILQKKREINRNFVGLYTIGVVVLTIGGSDRGLTFMAILNIMTAIFSVIAYLKLK
jgi:hypothetical protein